MKDEKLFGLFSSHLSAIITIFFCLVLCHGSTGFIQPLCVLQVHVSWSRYVPVCSDWTGVCNASGGGAAVQDCPMGCEHPPDIWQDTSRTAVQHQVFWGCHLSAPPSTLWNRGWWDNYCDVSGEQWWTLGSCWCPLQAAGVTTSTVWSNSFITVCQSSVGLNWLMRKRRTQFYSHSLISGMVSFAC